MEIDGFPLPDDIPSFPGQPEMLQYLNRFADYFNIRKYIKVRTLQIPVQLYWLILIISPHDVRNDQKQWKRTQNNLWNRFNTIAYFCVSHASFWISNISYVVAFFIQLCEGRERWLLLVQVVNIDA